MGESQDRQESLDLDIGFSTEPVGRGADASTTGHLAHELGMPPSAFVEVFGAGWRELPDQSAHVDADPSGSGDLFGHWHVAGNPYQLALRPQGDGVELGMPTGQWVSSGTLHWQIDERQHVAAGPDLAEAAHSAVTELLRTRRRTFRHCRFCRDQTAPEQLLDPDTCYGCGTEWLGFGN